MASLISLPEERIVALPKLGTVRIHALSLADYAAYLAFGVALQPEDLRLRFAHPVKPDDAFCRRYLSIDHDAIEAFGAFAWDGSLLGVGRLARLSEAEAEFALIVRSDLKRRGLGQALLDRLIEHARSQGIVTLRGAILQENSPMRSFASRVGFVVDKASGPMLEGHLTVKRVGEASLFV